MAYNMSMIFVGPVCSRSESSKLWTMTLMLNCKNIWLHILTPDLSL